MLRFSLCAILTLWLESEGCRVAGSRWCCAVLLAAVTTWVNCTEAWTASDLNSPARSNSYQLCMHGCTIVPNCKHMLRFSVGCILMARSHQNHI